MHWEDWKGTQVCPLHPEAPCLAGYSQLESLPTPRQTFRRYCLFLGLPQILKTVSRTCMLGHHLGPLSLSTILLFFSSTEKGQRSFWITLELWVISLDCVIVFSNYLSCHFSPGNLQRNEHFFTPAGRHFPRTQRWAISNQQDSQGKVTIETTRSIQISTDNRI